MSKSGGCLNLLSVGLMIERGLTFEITHRSTTERAIMSCMSYIFLAGILQGTTPVSVRFHVFVPRGTPSDARIYVAGNSPSLGAWRADGLSLRKMSEFEYEAMFEAREGERIEFKFTMGSWETVEKGKDGNEIPNRHLVVRVAAVDKNDRPTTTLACKIEQWASIDAKDMTPTKQPERTSTRTGNIRLHENFDSRALGNKRSIIVYLPPGYDDPKNKDEKYPVLYMHDGQNLFDAATSFIGIEWGADETAERLIEAKKIPPIIIVGIYNTPDRMNEYTPTRDDKRGIGGKGDEYASFVVNKLKPFIDETYRTRPERRYTAIAGSSLGGLISLHMAVRYPHLFSHFGVISPALFWDDHEIVRRIEEAPILIESEGRSEIRIWLDMGTKEGASLPDFKSAVDDTRRLTVALNKANLNDSQGNLKYVEVENAIHNEAAWAARFEDLLRFFWARDAKPYWTWKSSYVECDSNTPWYDRVKAYVPDDGDSITDWHPPLAPENAVEDAFELLLRTERFTNTEYPEKPAPGSNKRWWFPEDEAFLLIFRHTDATPAFRALLRRGKKAGQLYALCGLWLHDHTTFEREINRYRSDDSTVLANSGFETGYVSVKNLVERDGSCVVRLLPGQSIGNWAISNKCLWGGKLDIVGGGCSWALCNTQSDVERGGSRAGDLLIP